MHDHPIVVFMALLILGYRLSSKQAENPTITAPMVFVVIGLLVSFFDMELAGRTQGSICKTADGIHAVASSVH